MKRAYAATSLMLFLSSPCWAQSDRPRSNYNLPDAHRPFALPAPDRPVSLPILNYQEPNGSTIRARGIIVRHDVAPNISLGFGLMSLKPRRSTLSPDPTIEPSARGSRKAAARLTIAF